MHHKPVQFSMVVEGGGGGGGGGDYMLGFPELQDACGMNLVGGPAVAARGYGLLGFGAGQRQCPGIPFRVCEGAVGMATVGSAVVWEVWQSWGTATAVMAVRVVNRAGKLEAGGGGGQGWF